VIAAYARGLIDHGATVVMRGGTLQVSLLFHEDEIRVIRVAGRRSGWLKLE
jgi:diaminopimelate epimerase